MHSHVPSEWSVQGVSAVVKGSRNRWPRTDAYVAGAWALDIPRIKGFGRSTGSHTGSKYGRKRTSCPEFLPMGFGPTDYP